jgi:hypothetical protein
VWQGLLDGADAIAVDLGGDGTLEQIEGDDDAKRAFFGADDETLDAGEGAAVDADALAGTEVRPRHEEGLSGDEGSEIVNLTDSDGGWGVADADNLADAGHCQYTDAFGEGKAAKEIAGEEGLVQYLDAVGPSALDAAERQPGLEATARQFFGGEEFPASGCADGIPTGHRATTPERIRLRERTTALYI